MRDYIFRGFHPDESGSKTITLNGEKIRGEWVEGSLLSQANKDSRTYIVTHEVSFGACQFCGDCSVAYDPDCQIEVLPETVGIWTGLTDRIGNKIFEFDICCWRGNKAGYAVYFDECRFKIEDRFGNAIRPTQDSIKHLDVEVIGNMFEDIGLMGIE